MAFKDSLKNLFNYFELDGSQESEGRVEPYQLEQKEPKMRVAPAPISTERPVEDYRRVPVDRHQSVKSGIERLSERQQELSANNDKEIQKTTIDIKFPKKYEEAPEIVNLLLENATILIDFQFMSETQARRCLDYLDGARSVLSGNLKKVSNTMWLLTPVNVTVNIEELRTVTPASEAQFEAENYDIRRY